MKINKKLREEIMKEIAWEFSYDGKYSRDNVFRGVRRVLETFV